MQILRKNMITNDWVIISPDRAKRPSDFHKHEKDNFDLLAERPDYREACPFCKGNEKPDDKPIFTIDGDNGWLVRVLENKFASVDRNLTPDKRHTALKKEMNGFGIHDVIIDNPRHNTTLALMEPHEIETILEAYLRRYRELQDHPFVKHVVIFKNQGFSAGGSLEHPHSQIYGLPLIPFETQTRVNEVKKYYEFNESCLMCEIMKEELNEKIRVICENDGFVALSPYAALSPYHVWVVPKRHSPSFSLIEPGEIKSLASMMKTVFYKFFFGLRNPDFNYVFQSLTHPDRESDFFHWYISIIPQLKRRGGLEYAGGLFSNHKMPEDAAAELRDVPEGQCFGFACEK